MRCKRCHAVVAEGRKACPNCGTLIRKKRGSITLSSQSGVEVNRFTDGINDLFYNLRMAIRRDNRILIAFVAVPLVIVGIIMLLSCAGSSCSCSCSCGGDHSKKIKFGELLNSREPSQQTSVNETLYYIADGSIMSRSADESYKTIYDSISATDLQSDGEYLYFREDNKVKRISFNEPAVSGTDAARKVLDFDTEENYSLGYFLGEDKLYYYLEENTSGITVLYSDSAILSGAYSDFGYMKGKIYCTVSGTDIGKDICSMNVDGTGNEYIITGVLDYQLGGGYIYTISSDAEGKNILSRYDEKGKLLMEWDVNSLTDGTVDSIAANDHWLCFVALSEKGSTVYRIEHDSNDIATVFAYSEKVTLTGVSGDWYAFEKENQDGTKGYSIRNSRNGKSVL